MAKVEGVKEIKEALAEIKHMHAQGLARGLVRAGLWLQRESMLLVPVLTGQLKNSANTRQEGSGFEVSVVVSYGTTYAVYVHEDLEAAHGAAFNQKYAEKIAWAAKSRSKQASKARKYYFKRGPNQQAKFLETPLRTGRDKMRKMVVEAAKL